MDGALEAKVAQARMAVRAPSKWPVVFAIGFLDRQVVDACEAPPHQPRFVELPVLVAVGAEPPTRVIVPFVREANRDPVSFECPELLYEPIVNLPGPLRVRKAIIASRPCRNSARFLQRESTV